MATAEFSKFVGILSAALSQHHLNNHQYRKETYTSDSIVSELGTESKVQSFELSSASFSICKMGSQLSICWCTKLGSSGL